MFYIFTVEIYLPSKLMRRNPRINVVLMLGHRLRRWANIKYNIALKLRACWHVIDTMVPGF